MQFCCHQRYAGDIAARASKATDKAGFNRVARQNDNRNLTGSTLCCEGAGSVNRDDDIDLKRNQLCSKPRKSFQLSFGRSELEQHVLPFDVAGAPQSFL